MANQFIAFLKLQFKQGNTVKILLILNIGIYLTVNLGTIVLQLFNIDISIWINYLKLPAAFPFFLHQPWSILTYMFMHTKFLHLFLNMLCLYWFSKFFLDSFQPKQLTSLYLLGGLTGGIFYMLAYNIFPYFSDRVDNQLLLGASGSIMAIVVAAAVATPNRSLRLLFIGNIPITYLATGTVLISMLGMTGDNAGGEFAHLGGAFMGYVYAFLLVKKGKDIAAPLVRLFDSIARLFKPQKRQQDARKKFHYVKSDADYNVEKKQNNANLDKILDKIRQSGYSSLTEEEKKRMFDSSQNL